ncbi:MAG: DoxX family membrane protein [Bacteroidales bacterium]|nr:DoxX family membrane protein [Bacteroidales bacterium]
MNKGFVFKALSYIYILLVLILAYLISFFQDYNLIFLISLVLMMIIGGFLSKKMPKGAVLISRILIGLLFIYSGFVKGVDPLGTQFRIEDYFYAFGTLWALPFALTLSVLLNAFEFSMGLFLLFNLRTKLVSWLVFLMMIFFTITTLNDALYSPVPDCGCFGDALIISNWQTFYKNLVIFALVLILFLRQNSVKSNLKPTTQFSLMIGLFVLFAAFEIHTIRHLPILDFRPWKVGTRLLPENPQPAKFYFVYKNKDSGEEKEFLSSELPWQDTVFMSQWSYESSREVNPDADLYKTFPMLDSDGNDLSAELAKSEQPVFLMIVYDIMDADDDALKKFLPIYNLCQQNGWTFYMLNSDTPDDLKKRVEENELNDFPVLNSDDTSLKAAIRANPGLVILRNGVVKSKFNHRDIPDMEELNSLATE